MSQQQQSSHSHTSITMKCCQISCAVIVLVIMLQSLYFTHKLFPEIGMVLQSQCRTPAPGWNGKLLGYEVESIVAYLYISHPNYVIGLGQSCNESEEWIILQLSLLIIWRVTCCLWCWMHNIAKFLIVYISSTNGESTPILPSYSSRVYIYIYEI